MMARPIICALLLLVSVVLSSMLAVAPSASTDMMEASSWTIMVYMADDTTSSLDWMDDLNEMEAAQSADEVKIIALVDPYGPNNSLIYNIENDPNLFDPTIVSSVVNDSGAVIVGDEADMALPLTLQSFVQFAASTNPVDKNVLVLWGHGAGWRGMCPDGLDLLTLPELSQALDGATATIGRPIDLVVIDSCVGATVEALWEMRDSVRFLVGSEKDVPFQGLPYDIIIADLSENSNQSVEDFATTVADEYVLWSGANTDYSVTMGVFDLSKMDPLVDALETLSVQGTKYNPIFHSTLEKAFNDSETYEEHFSVDCQHFAWQLQNSDLPLEIRYAAYQSLVAIRDIVVHFAKHANPTPVNGVGVTNASGVTIHAPADGTTEEAYASISLASSSWLEFGQLLRSSALPIPNGPGPSVSYESIESSNDSAVIAWPDGTQHWTIWIFRNQTSGLALTTMLDSSDQIARLTGLPGPLTLATSSFSNGSLSSYRTVNVTLYGAVSVNVKLMLDGETVSSPDNDYEVFLVTARDERVLPSFEPSASDNIYSIHIRVPDDAGIGDVATVQVVDESTGKLVGVKRIFIQNMSDSESMTVDLARSCERPNDFLVPLFFALLPGLLILAFAFSLYYEAGRHRKGPDETD